MTDTFSFVVEGTPVAWQRAGVVAKAGFVRHYTKAKTLKYEHQIAVAAREAWGSGPPMDGPVELALTVYVKIPQSWSKKKTLQAEAGEIQVATKPDLDNYMKCVTDAMNEIVYIDDSQIVRATIQKLYTQRPRIEVDVSEVVPVLAQAELEVAA